MTAVLSPQRRLQHDKGDYPDHCHSADPACQGARNIVGGTYDHYAKAMPACLSWIRHWRGGDTLRVKVVSIPAANDGSSAAVKYNSDGTFFSATYLYEGNAFSSMTFHNTANGIVITTHDPQYIRISPIYADTSVVIMTKTKKYRRAQMIITLVAIS